jgi:hypothetical protein
MRHTVALLLSLFLLLANRAHAQSFSIGLEQVVSNGQPGPGAGNIETAGGTDVYTLVITQPTSIYAQEISGSCGIGWTMTGTSAETIFSDVAMCGTDPGVRLLPSAGTYTITVQANASTSGAYSFVIWQLNPPESFSIVLEQTVTNGSPAVGAGNLEEPGAIDLYTLPISAPTGIYAQDINGGCAIRWSLTAPSGALVFDDVAMCGTDPGTHQLTEVGDYTVKVYATTDATGTYSFNIFQLNPVESFPLSFKSTVSNGVPGPGAGNIEESGAVDEYLLDVTEPTAIFADFLTGGCSQVMSITAPSGAIVLASGFLCTPSAGALVLPEVGQYTVRVKGVEGATGTYSFVFWELNDPDTFSVAVGDTIAAGVPGPGAGNLEEPGAIDTYLLPISVPTTVLFDAINGSCGIFLTVLRPDGSQLFSKAVCADMGEYLLGTTGTYTLKVSGANDVFGAYSLALIEVDPPQTFDLALEQSIAPGSPAIGAGLLEAPGSIDDYRLTLTAGQQVIPQCFSGGCNVNWILYAPSGAAVTPTGFLCNGTLGLFTITENGIHTLRVDGVNDATGEYTAVVHLLDLPQDFAIAIGDTVAKNVPGRGAGNLPEPYAVDRYGFTATAGAEVCLKEWNGNCPITWTLTAPSGAVLFTDNFCGTTPGRFTLAESGTYVISVGGDINDMGTYSFTLEESSAADLSPDNGDCSVNAADLAVLLGAWGPCVGCAADLDGDGQVNAADLAILLGDWN